MDLVTKFPSELESCREDLQILRKGLQEIRALPGFLSGFCDRVCAGVQFASDF